MIMMRRAKWNVYTEEQLLKSSRNFTFGYWEAYVQNVMEPQIAAFRPAVSEADPNGVFRHAYLDKLLGIPRS
jgi:hypothetical protein